MDYLYHIGTMICIYAILCQGFNVPFGLARSFNLAHTSFFAVGAYATALLSTEAGAAFWQCMLVSALLPGLLALLIGSIALRLTDDYFAIGTLAFASVVEALLINWKSLTHGVLGIPGIPRPSLLGLELNETGDFFLLSVAVFACCQAVLFLFFRGGYPRSLRALAEDVHAALGLGVNRTESLNSAFFIASLFSGIAGSLYATYLSFIDPSSFGFSEMVIVLTVCILGKPGSFWGIIVSTIVVVAAIPEGLRMYTHFDSSVLGPARQMLNAILLFLVAYFGRRTLFPQSRKL